jgi:hypothetical protein
MSEDHCAFRQYSVAMGFVGRGQRLQTVVHGEVQEVLRDQWSSIDIQQRLGSRARIHSLYRTLDEVYKMQRN